MGEKLSKHFWRSEWACKCDCGLDTIDLRLMPIAEIIRHHEGDKSMTPNSGCRCKEYNEIIQMRANPDYVAYSSKSKHMPNEDQLCTAGDFPSDNPKKLYKFLCSLFPNTYGIGVYSWGVHVDTRMAKARWGDV